MAIEPVKIPQNIYVEDRIIGPITLKQIMIVMGSSGISYAIWAVMKSAGPVSGVQTFLSWTPTIIGILFAFVKINGISLFRIVLLLLERIDKPARRVWMPRKGIYVNIVTKQPEKKDTSKEDQKARESSQIEELSRVLDQGPPEVTEVTEEEAAKAKPVKRDRIQADKRKKPVDDIQKPQDERSSGSGGLFRDISPPPSHA